MHRPGRGLTGAAAAAVIAAACGGDGGGDDAPDAAPAARLELVGHSDLGARGMNAALAVAGDTVYVGSRIDGAEGRTAGVLIVDVSDPTAPAVVGELGPPDQGVTGISSRELRAIPELDLLVVLNLQCSEDLHGCNRSAVERENLKLYDISDRRAPVRIATYPFTSTLPGSTRSPHELYLWRDPAEPARVLAFVTTPPSRPQLEVVDLTDPAAPARVAAWNPTADGTVPPVDGDNLMHSVSLSADGRAAYVSHLRGGLFVADTSAVIDRATEPAITAITPPGRFADWAPPEPAGPHSAVPVPGRDLLVVTDEVYPPPFGAGCPWGWLRVVDVADPAAPAVTGEVRVAENDPAFCGGPGDGARITYTAHNATVTPHLALVSWHAAGLQVIDLTDPAAPRAIAELRPEPLPAVAVEDPGLGGHPIAMWSYPVVQDGLIYVVDLRNGLYVLRYHGPYADELAGFAEGNSNR